MPVAQVNLQHWTFCSGAAWLIDNPSFAALHASTDGSAHDVSRRQMLVPSGNFTACEEETSTKVIEPLRWIGLMDHMANTG